MKLVTYPQTSPWSWPNPPLPFADPEQWQPRKWMEQITRQLRSADLPAVAQQLLGAQSAALPEPTGRSLTPLGENRKPVSAVRDCVLIRQRGRQFLTALRGMDNHLQLLSWRVNADGAVVRTGESGVQPETVTQLDIAQASKFVIACRTANHHVKLISWDVSNTGAIYRAGESQEQSTAIRQVKVVALSPALLLTAAITATGQLQLTSWQLDDHAALAPLAEVANPTALRELALVYLPSPVTAPRVMTVGRTRHGDLQLQVWQVNQGGAITLLGEATSAGPWGAQIHAVVNEQGTVITSLRTPGGQLRLCAWQVSPDGSQLVQVADSGVGGEQIRQQTLLPFPGGVITAITLPQGRVQLITWEIGATGQITRNRQGDKCALAARNLALCPALLDGNAPILTSMRTAQGGLRLITWQS